MKHFEPRGVNVRKLARGLLGRGVQFRSAFEWTETYRPRWWRQRLWSPLKFDDLKWSIWTPCRVDPASNFSISELAEVYCGLASLAAAAFSGFDDHDAVRGRLATKVLAEAARLDSSLTFARRSDGAAGGAFAVD